MNTLQVQIHKYKHTNIQVQMTQICRWLFSSVTYRWTLLACTSYSQIWYKYKWYLQIRSWLSSFSRWTLYVNILCINCVILYTCWRLVRFPTLSTHFRAFMKFTFSTGFYWKAIWLACHSSIVVKALYARNGLVDECLNVFQALERNSFHRCTQFEHLRLKLQSLNNIPVPCKTPFGSLNTECLWTRLRWTRAFCAVEIV